MSSQDHAGCPTIYRPFPGPIGALGVFVDAGSAHEPKPGLAHLTEHLVFRGSRTRTGAQILADDTRLGGHGNAYTSEDEVGYTTSVLAQDMPKALAHLLDFVLSPSFPCEAFDAERRIIHAEIATQEDQPEWQVLQVLNAQVWGAHAYGRAIAGTHADLDALTLDDVCDYHATHYTPDRIQIVQVGGVKPEPRPLNNWGRRITPLSAYRPPSSRAITHVPGGQAHVYVGTRLPAPSHPDFPALVRLTDILGGSGSSRLSMEIRENRGLAYSVGAGLDVRVAGTLWCAYVGCHPSNVDTVVDVIQATLADVAQTPISDAELESAHTYRTIVNTFAEETAGDVVRKVRQDMVHHGCPQPPLPACDASRLRAAAEAWFTGPMAVSIGLPDD